MSETTIFVLVLVGSNVIFFVLGYLISSLGKNDELIMIYNKNLRLLRERNDWLKELDCTWGLVQELVQNAVLDPREKTKLISKVRECNNKQAQLLEDASDA